MFKVVGLISLEEQKELMSIAKHAMIGIRAQQLNKGAWNKYDWLWENKRDRNKG